MNPSPNKREKEVREVSAYMQDKVFALERQSGLTSMSPCLRPTETFAVMNGNFFVSVSLCDTMQSLMNICLCLIFSLAICLFVSLLLHCVPANTEGDKRGDKAPADDKVRECGDEDDAMINYHQGLQSVGWSYDVCLCVSPE